MASPQSEVDGFAAGVIKVEFDIPSIVDSPINLLDALSIS